VVLSDEVQVTMDIKWEATDLCSIIGLDFSRESFSHCTDLAVCGNVNPACRTFDSFHFPFLPPSGWNRAL
jgi:hypothetical protein